MRLFKIFTSFLNKFKKPEQLVGKGIIQLVWRESYECGDPVIDGQHQELFKLGNALVNALLDGEPKEKVEIMINDFVDHIVDHFRTEESMMKHTEDPEEKQHREVHQKLLERATQLKARFHNHDSNMVIRDLVSFVAYDVVACHMILEDPKVNK
jgi:hemerythrin